MFVDGVAVRVDRPHCMDNNNVNTIVYTAYTAYYIVLHNRNVLCLKPSANLSATVGPLALF